MWATLAQACRRSPPRSSSCSTRASIRAPRTATIAPSARRRSSPRSRTALAAVDSLDEDRIVRRFVNAVQSAIRTNYYQLDKDGQPKPEISIKFSSRKLDGVPKPRAALRNLRLFAALRRRAHALRQGGARRHPLVRPAAGLPHRNPRPGEGAAGQERGDRAGRLQGRLRAEAHAGRRHARGDPGRGRRDLQAVHVSRCSTSPTTSISRAWCRPTTWCATTTTIPISSSPPTRAPRPSPTSPTRISERARLLARRRLRLRRLGRLRPQGHGHHRARRLGIGEAPFPRDGHRHHARRRSPTVGVGDMSGDVFGNGMLREKTMKLLAAFDHRDIFIDPDPDPEKSFAERKRHVRAAALELAGLRQDADLQGRRRVPALARRRSRCRRRRRGASASPRPRRRRRR